MKNIFEFGDCLGPDKIIHIYDHDSGLKAIVVVDNVACGPAMGGVRMAPDVTTEEVFRLARAMTLKNAAADLSHGGGKAAILSNPKVSAAKKEILMRAFGRAIKDITDYIPGPDMGTDEACMAWVREETGRAIGLPATIGGIPLDEVGATGYGLSVVADVASNFCHIDLIGAKFVIQGTGSVGLHAAKFLTAQGAILIGATDSQGTLFNSNGIDVTQLTKLKGKKKSVLDYTDGDKLSRDAIIDIPCDIWIPAARPDVIRADNVHRLKTKLVIQGANIPFTAKAEQICHDRNILVIPDFIANAGGVICGAVEYGGGNQEIAFQTIEEKIRKNITLMLENVVQTDKLPRQIAIEMAEQRIRRATAYRSKSHGAGLQLIA
ncbi:Glu/Leu/Phe/Val family dehydrogenase [Leptothoe spongobia]|uniref:Glutamate dehydrogenase n=1 Tax=Leptothoe spongobia TAU-MAC 1115 TaxID=1967444 RepID=A0A947DD00_9CYAN|nr:Glu/Leu/Phe/Val dehydrogenase [Leptothoe spongobia]MBT9314821.1 Glu/Leu/Phe/Val dehydrogenase [Leptothoe spongobia TAU-MAC 1115]